MKHLLSLFFIFLSAWAYGQNRQNYASHRVAFTDIKGFTGYVTFETRRDGMATQLTGGNAELVITGYKADGDEIEALRRAGLDLRSSGGLYKPERFGFEVEGQAYIHDLSFAAVPVNANAPSRLHINHGLVGHTTPTFDSEGLKKHQREWQNRDGNHDQSYWERFGGYRPQRVTALYLSDLENDIASILADYRRQLNVFDSYITQGTTAANAFDFETAKSALEAAQELSLETTDHSNKIQEVENLIRQKEKQQEEKKREEEEEKKREEQKAKKESSRSDDEDKNSADKKEESTFDANSAYVNYMREANNARARGDYATANRYLQMAKNLNIYGTQAQIDKQMQDNNISHIADVAAPLLANAFDKATGVNVLLEFGYIEDKHEWKQYKLAIVNQGYWWNFFTVSFGVSLTYLEDSPMWVMDNGYAIAKSELSPNFSSYISDDQMVFRDISVSSGTISMQYKAYEKKTTSFGMEPALGLGFYLPFKYIRPNFLITGFYGPSLTGYSDYYGYRLSGRLDFGKRITLGVNYATIIHDKDAFLPSYFSPGRGNYTLTDMNDLTENNTRKHNRIELTLGIKLATWGN